MNRHPVSRAIQLVGGVLLIILGCVIGPLPGPGGIFFFAGGLILILRNSHWARRRFARAKRRWPRIGDLLDRTMRRPSALRRRARARDVVARAAHQDRIDRGAASN
ncbi:MAG: hypothetical protein OSB00_18115 [Sphingomonas bacterium]|nr:hypothetical protein [Sphingomonas bacterium]